MNTINKMTLKKKPRDVNISSGLQKLKFKQQDHQRIRNEKQNDFQ